MAETLYQQLGGERRIAAIIEDALDRHAVNPALAPTLHGKDLGRLKELGVHFFCAGFGGPQTYEGLDLRSTHARLTEQAFAAAIRDIVAALDAHAVAPAAVDEVVDTLLSLRRDNLPARQSDRSQGVKS